MVNGFDNKAVLKKFNSNIFATNRREYSAGIIATFAVTLALVLVRIMSSLGAFSPAFFSTPTGELVISLIWPILGGFVVPIVVYFSISDKGEIKEKFSRDKFKQNFHNFGFRKISKELLLLSIVFGILYSLANQGIAMVSQSILIMLGLNLSGGSVSYGGFGHLLIMVFTSAILPAICEETVDRGILTYALKKRGDKFAIIMTAAVFAFTHMSIAQTFYTFMMGLIIGYIVVKTGNIIPGIITHFINNFGGTVFHYLYVKDLPGKEAYGLIDYLANENPLLLFGLWGVAIFLSVILAKFMVKFDSQQKALKRKNEAVQALSDINGTDNIDVGNSNARGDEFVESFAHYEPYKPAFKYEIFLYAMLILNVGATVFSVVWSL